MPFSGGELFQQIGLEALAREARSVELCERRSLLALTVISPPPLSSSMVMMPCFLPYTPTISQHPNFRLAALKHPAWSHDLSRGELEILSNYDRRTTQALSPTSN